MIEIMGGIKRIIARGEAPHPDLLASRLEEQKQREHKGEKKPKEPKIKFSKLQLRIIELCVKNGRETGSYSAKIDDIIDDYYGKYSGMRRGKQVAVARAIRTLTKKDLAKLMPQKVGQVELTDRMINIAQDVARNEDEDN